MNKNQSAPSSLCHHFSYLKNIHEHYHELIKYIRSEDMSQCIIFSNSRHGAEKLFKHLLKDFDSVEFIHGGMEQSRRTSIFNRFKRKDIKFMVATDVAGRGLDFTHVSHVINFEFPRDIEAYTHRTGRTGRMGRKGVAMTFVTARDFGKFRFLMKTNNLTPTWLGGEPEIKRPAKRPRYTSSGPTAKSKNRPKNTNTQRNNKPKNDNPTPSNSNNQ